MTRAFCSAADVVGGRTADKSLWTNQRTFGVMESFAPNEENNVFKSANLFAASVPENTLKLRASVTITENRVQAMVSGDMVPFMYSFFRTSFFE